MDMQTSVKGVRLELWAWFVMQRAHADPTAPAPAPADIGRANTNERVQRWCAQQMYLANACGTVLVALVHTHEASGVSVVVPTLEAHVRDLDPHLANATNVDAEWREAASEARARIETMRAADKSDTGPRPGTVAEYPNIVKRAASHAVEPVKPILAALGIGPVPVAAPKTRSAHHQFEAQVSALSALEGRSTRSRARLLR